MQGTRNRLFGRLLKTRRPNQEVDGKHPLAFRIHDEWIDLELFDVAACCSYSVGYATYYLYKSLDVRGRAPPISFEKRRAG